MDDHFSLNYLLFGGRFTRNTNDRDIQAVQIGTTTRRNLLNKLARKFYRYVIRRSHNRYLFLRRDIS